MTTTRRSRQISCIKLLSILITSRKVPVDGFQTIRPHQLIRIRSQLGESERQDIASDALDRRSFLSNSIVASLAFLTLPNPTYADSDAETDNEIEIEPTITTPSISSGELTLSSPPPNRAQPIIEPPTPKSADTRFFIAGGASAAISHGMTTPIDVVKTRMQSDESLGSLSPPAAAFRIAEREGTRALTAGLGPTVVGYGLEGALKFGAYESLKPMILSSTPVGGEAYLLAAVCAGALASIVLCPMEETRIRLVTDPSFGKGLLDGLPRLLEEEGYLSPFRRGMPPMLAKQVPYTIGKQVSFDVFAGMLYSFLVGLSFVPQKEIALEVEVGAAFMASVVACLASHPGDVLLTATYKNREGQDGGFGATVRRVYEDGGAAAFFRGLNARFLHVGCIITFQLVIYDQIKQALGLPASGS